ncbi:hypothetical protein SH139x_001577 [Planctomycetaceae bacterium SH139]
MNQRTMLLAAGAGAVFLLFLLDKGYRDYIEVPTQRIEGQLDALAGELDEANRAQVMGRRLAKQLDEYATRALPYEPALARSRYREWLLQLMEQHQMTSAAIDAESPRVIEVRGRVNRRQRRKVGHSITYTLRARTTLARLTDFLHDFNHSAQLHKIRRFGLTPLVDGNQLDLNLVVETMTLEATERSEELSAIVRDDTTYVARAEYDDFVERNLFARGFSKSLGQIRLNAITTNREGLPEAWFAVGSPPQTQRISAGDSLQLPLHRVTLVSFAERRVALTVNGLECSIELGQTLADVFDQGDAASGEVSEEAEQSPSDRPSVETEPAPAGAAVAATGSGVE